MHISSKSWILLANNFYRCTCICMKVQSFPDYNRKGKDTRNFTSAYYNWPNLSTMETWYNQWDHSYLFQKTQIYSHRHKLFHPFDRSNSALKGKWRWGNLVPGTFYIEQVWCSWLFDFWQSILLFHDEINHICMGKRN